MDALANLDATVIALAATLASLLALILVVLFAVRQRKLLNRYKALLNGTAGSDLEQMLLTQAAQLETAQTTIDHLKKAVEGMQHNARLHVQRVGTVRFNAFPDTGSDLSFAIALLDANNNGVVISSLYGRNESRIYAKPIENGQSTYTLSEEEKSAIAKATGQTA